MDQTKPIEYLCALDIETVGRANGSMPISVGFCYGTNWEDRKKVRISIRPNSYHCYHEKYGQFFNLHNAVELSKLSITDEKRLDEHYIQDICEPATWSEFWSKNKEILLTLLTEGKSVTDGFQELSNFIKKLYSIEKLTTNTKRPYKVTFLGDNPAYDFGRLDAALEKYCDELPIRYSNRRTLTELRELAKEGFSFLNDGYHGIKDPSERVKFFEKSKLLSAIVDQNTAHTHMPDDDAEGIYLQYLLMKDEKFLDSMCEKLPNWKHIHIGIDNTKYST